MSAPQRLSWDPLLLATLKQPRFVLLCLVTGVAVGLALAFFVPPRYTARTAFLPPQQQQSSAAAALASLGTLAGLAGAASIRNPADQYAALMQSANVTDRIIKQFKLMDVYEERYLSDARKAFLENVRIQAGKKDGMITVEVDDRDPARAAAIANAMVDELRRLTGTLAVTEAQQRRVFFEREMQRTQTRLVVAQQKLQASGIDQGTLKAEPKAAAEGYARLKAQAVAAEVRLQSMRTYLSANAPELQQEQATLQALRQQLALVEQSGTQHDSTDYVSRYREFKYQETLFELFAKQYELARLDESREGALIQVVDVAVPPDKRSKPSRVLLFAAGLIGTTLLAVGAALGRVATARPRTTGTM